MSKAAWGETLPLSGSLLGLAKVLVSLPNSDLFRSCFTFAMSHVPVLWFVCLFLLQVQLMTFSPPPQSQRLDTGPHVLGKYPTVELHPPPSPHSLV